MDSQEGLKNNLMMELAYKVDRTEDCIQMLQQNIDKLTHLSLEDCYSIKKYMYKHINSDQNALLKVGE